MLAVAIDQIGHLNNFFIQSYYAGQVYVTNEIIHFSEQNLTDENRCEWSFNAIALANSILRRYDAADHVVIFAFLS